MNSDTQNILVVDDDQYVLESISALLRECGYSVISCNSGERAIKQFLENKIELVLSDIRMPGVSGIELLDRIRSIDSRMPVILMTGYAELNVAIDAIKRGAFDFVTKPYNPNYIIHTIEKAVKHARLLRLEEEYKHRLEETVKQQTQEIINLSREVIKRLTAVAEFRDTETGAHISRIGLYANKIAEFLSSDIEFMDAITYASSLHDIGKIAISDDILLKPGCLTEEEFSIMKSHTLVGHDILEGSIHSTLKMAAMIALTHHERWDGSGYPRGLSGEDIPIEGRIVIICDQYDALMSKRPYKPPLSHSEVFKVITEGDGRTMPGHFDPQIMKAFIKNAAEFEEIFNSHQD
jgi:putative two-component system response regulator